EHRGRRLLGGQLAVPRRPAEVVEHRVGVRQEHTRGERGRVVPGDVEARRSGGRHPFVQRLEERMASTGAARFNVAWHDTAPLAACVFLTHADTMLYYLGGSTRNRELTTKQAPTAVF